MENLTAPSRIVLGLTLLVTLWTVNRASAISAVELRAADAVASTYEGLYVPDTRFSRALTLGYDQAAADLLWVRTIGYFTRHFLSDREYDWLEHFIEQILTLDPQWRKVYHWAGASVLYGRRFTNANVELSNRFYLKALERFPEDYEAAYRLGLNYYIEMKSPDPAERRRFQEIGLAWLERAANTPRAPGHVRSLVAGISRRMGKSQLAMQYLVDLYLKSEDPETKADLKARIEGLQREQVEGEDVARSAERFRDGWQGTFPYVPPPLYSLMGEPTELGIADVSWRTLLPDVNLEDASDNGEEAKQ